MPKVLVTGGTGSIGHEVVRQALIKGWDCIVLSRDESMQADMKQEYPNVEYVLGDVEWVRDLEYCLSLGPDYVVHCAAMKHVPICEQQPLKAVQTNVLGTINVLLTFAGTTKNVVIVSTDKTVEPVCVMGYTKKLCEAMVRDPAFQRYKVCAVRFGNIIPSRGSVIPLWLDAKRRGLPLKITDPEMTRYFVPVQEAVATIFAALEHGQSGDIWVPMVQRVRLGDLAEVIANGGKMEIVGIRTKEKRHELLFSVDEEPRLVTVHDQPFWLLRRGDNGDTPQVTSYFETKEGIAAMLDRALGDTWR